jgi:acyl-CoA thioesterase II
VTPPVATRAVRAWLDLMELAPAGVDEFVAGPAVPRPARVFGGQLLAQGLRAAGLTLAGAGLQPAALHAQFVRAGRADGELCYRVERVHDGRSTAWRAVVASQDGQTVCRLEASFCRPGRGVDFHGGVPPPVPPAEPSVPGPVAYDLSWSVLPRVVELRRVRRAAPDSVPVAAAWLRAADRLPDDPLVHAALLAWASDLTASDCVTQFYGAIPGDGAVAVASLDHHLWFHKSVRADGWLLLDQRSEIAAAGRALTTGVIYAEDGDRIASLTQLALVRPSNGAVR